jgi:hypothetical protein
VLDPFVGSCVAILADEGTGRGAGAFELDPLHVDTALKRWQRIKGKIAIFLGSPARQAFSEVQRNRCRTAGIVSDDQQREG